MMDSLGSEFGKGTQRSHPGVKGERLEVRYKVTRRDTCKDLMRTAGTAVAGQCNRSEGGKRGGSLTPSINMMTITCMQVQLLFILCFIPSLHELEHICVYIYTLAY